MFKSIVDFEDEKLWSSTIIRICLLKKTEFYYTDRVFDLIIFENYTEDMGLGAFIVSGYKAGKISFFFPKEAYCDDSFYSISTKWVKNDLLRILNIETEKAELFILKNLTIVLFSS